MNRDHHLYKSLFEERVSLLSQLNRHRQIAIIEILFGIAILLGISAALHNFGWGMLNLQPHPLWIILLAIAVRYGGGYGYLAGGLCGVSYGLLLWSRPDVHFRPLEPHLLIQPLLMFIVGAVIGEIVRSRETLLLELKAQRVNDQKDLVSLWERYERLDKIRTRLEKQIAFQSNSVEAFASLIQRLQSLNLAELHKVIVDMFPTLLEIESCSLYLYQGEYLWLDSGTPSEIEPIRPECLSIDDPLLQRVIRERRAVSVGDHGVREQNKFMGDHSTLMAGPVILSDGQIYGAVLVESAPFTAVTPSSMARFTALLHWAALALDNALSYEELRASSGMNGNTDEPNVGWMVTLGANRDRD